jgi:UDP-N-acetylglucosamine--N-acetylmuramyl-(pentapeptide) pyrophosphoryl-undecaprenol N-acetylglucosamine transferase
MGNLDSRLHVALACGGTGGHIFPGLATAEVLHARGHTITLWLAGKDIEAEAVGDREWTTYTVPAKGFEGGWKKAPGILLGLLKARRMSRAYMQQDVPDVLLGMGSYACSGPVSAALKLGVPVVLHEANAVPGKAVNFFAGRATRVAASFEATRHALKNKARLNITGLPLRAELTAEAKRPRSPREADEPFRILCMGGSRGARALNQIVRRAVRDLHEREPNIFITHLTGRNDEEEVRTCYEKAGVPHRVAAFEHNMAAVYRETDLAVCRAGAATCAELSVFGIPALLVPYPFAAGNHQFANADEFSRLNAADLIEERDLEVGWLTDYFEGTIHTPERLERMRVNLRKRGGDHAAERLADLVEEAAADV